MRAVTIHGFGDEDVLSIDDVPTPQPGEQQVRVKVAAAAVNRADINTRTRVYPIPAPGPEGYRLGMDASGVVDAVGSGVSGLQTGDNVIGFSDSPLQVGAQAEYVVLPTDAVTSAPRAVPLVQAATLPLNGLTATQALQAAGLSQGGTVVVTGAAGGLGMFVVQLARLAGHHVVAWVKQDTDADYVRSLGADAVITGPTAATSRTADAVIDAATIGQDTIDLIRDGGTYVAFRQIAPTLDRGISQVDIGVHTDGAVLARLVRLVDAGELRLPDVVEMPLGDVAAAQHKLHSGGTRKRFVLVP